MSRIKQLDQRQEYCWQWVAKNRIESTSVPPYTLNTWTSWTHQQEHNVTNCSPRKKDRALFSLADASSMTVVFYVQEQVVSIQIFSTHEHEKPKRQKPHHIAILNLGWELQAPVKVLPCFPKIWPHISRGI